jgi:Protein of unknown function (DUF3225)
VTVARYDVDLPDVRAEVEAIALAYERALVGNDAATLDSMFWDDPRALRFGIADTQYGYDAIRKFRAGLTMQSATRDIVRLEIHTFGRDFAVVNLVFRYHTHPGGGRQSQTWVRTAAATHGGWRVVSAHVDLTET